MDVDTAIKIADLLHMIDNQVRNARELLMQHRMHVALGPQLEAPEDLHAMRERQVANARNGTIQPAPPTREQQRQAAIHGSLAQAKAIAGALAHNAVGLHNIMNGQQNQSPPAEDNPGGIVEAG